MDSELISKMTLVDRAAENPDASSPPDRGPERAYPPTSRRGSATVPVTSLLPSNNSPRLEGENLEHARALAESEAAVPPILVHRQTGRVIDGMHRLHAALLRGDTEVVVEYFDGSDDDAFIAAVRANITHGYPLSRSDRRAAAIRILRSHPNWSDRAIAEVTGLAARTVAGIRRSTAEVPQMDTRMGRDGRARPVDGEALRQRVQEMLQRHPDASLRKIASAAGVSPTTVRNVRQRMRSGEDPADRVDDSQASGPRQASPPLPAASPSSSTGPAVKASVDRPAGSRRGKVRDPASILRSLRGDPSLRYTDSGRALIRFLDLQLTGLAECRKAAESVAPHCRYALIELAGAVSEHWRAFADDLKKDTDADSA